MENGQKGWVFFGVKKTAKATGKKFDTVAASATAGLVAKGWSKDYAAKHGADFSKVLEIQNRTLDLNRFTQFLEEEE